jgi:anti-sigma B factor antagonist
MNITIENNANCWKAIVTGRLDTANAPIFESGIQPLLEHADGELELDCTDLQYISSSGLRQFLALRKTVAAKGGKLTVLNINNSIKDIFKMTGFLSLFDFR